MSFIAREEAFTCEHCHIPVQPLGKGTYRNHCPQCLWSKHVDESNPGDRQSICLGLMPPIGVEHRGGKGWMIVHRCEKCGKTITNILAPDDDQAIFATLNHSKLK